MAVALSGIRDIRHETKVCLSALFNATHQQQTLPHAFVVSSLWAGDRRSKERQVLQHRARFHGNRFNA